MHATGLRPILTLVLVALLGCRFAQSIAERLPDWFPITFVAELSGDQVVPLADQPAVETEGSGAVIAVLSGNRLVVSGSFQNLRGSITLGVNVRMAPPGGNGTGVRFTVVPGLTGRLNDNALMLPHRSGDTAGAISAVFELSDEQVQELMAGLYYLQAYTTAYPAGELRGQLLPLVDLSDVVFDPEARVATAEDMVGVWQIEGGDEDGWQIYESGLWTYLGTMAEIGETPRNDRTWWIEDGIYVAYNGTVTGPNCSGGPYISYEMVLPDGSRQSLALQGPEGCWPYGRWTHYLPVEP